MPVGCPAVLEARRVRVFFRRVADLFKRPARYATGQQWRWYRFGAGAALRAAGQADAWRVNGPGDGLKNNQNKSKPERSGPVREGF